MSYTDVINSTCLLLFENIHIPKFMKHLIFDNLLKLIITKSSRDFNTFYIAGKLSTGLFKYNMSIC